MATRHCWLDVTTYSKQAVLLIIYVRLTHVYGKLYAERCKKASSEPDESAAVQHANLQTSIQTHKEESFILTSVSIMSWQAHKIQRDAASIRRGPESLLSNPDVHEEQAARPVDQKTTPVARSESKKICPFRLALRHWADRYLERCRPLTKPKVFTGHSGPSGKVAQRLGTLELAQSSEHSPSPGTLGGGPTSFVGPSHPAVPPLDQMQTLSPDREQEFQLAQV